jgi:hypothetical protein
VFAAFERVSSKEQKLKSLSDFRKELSELLKHQPDTTALSAVDLGQLKTLQQLENQVAGYQSSLTVVDEVETKISSMKDRVESFNQEILGLLKSLGMEEQWSSFEISVPTGYLDLLVAKRRNLSTSIEQLKSGSGVAVTIASTLAQIRVTTEALNLSQSKKAAFEKFEKDRSK